MTPYAGVNLRQNDLPGFVAACRQAGIAPSQVPILYTLHDDSTSVAQDSINAALNAGLDVRIWRCFSYNNQAAPPLLPHGATVIGWNENGNGDDESANPNLPGWVDSWWQWVRATRPDLSISYGAPNVDGYWLENTALEAALDSVGRHIGSTFSPPPAIIQGKPVYVTEIDIDPTRYPDALASPTAYPWADQATMDTAYGELRDCLERCLAAGIPAFAWGVNPYTPDAAYDPTLLKALVALNAKYANPTQGGTDVVDANDPVIVDLKKQIADFTEGMRRIVEGRYNGPDGAAAIVVALEGGSDPSIQPQPDYSPKA